MGLKSIKQLVWLILSAVVVLGGCAAQNNIAAKSEETSPETAPGIMAESETTLEPAGPGEQAITTQEVLADTEPALKAFSLGAQAGYLLKEAWIRSENAEVRYPVIEGFPDPALEAEMNKAIYAAVNGYVASASNDGDMLTLDYEVTRMDQQILSVVITGLQPHDQGAYEVMFSVNLDTTNSKELKASNLFMNDEASRQALTALIQSTNPGFSSEYGPWLGIYFEKDQVNFFYLENDKAAVYNVIPVPLELALPYMKAYPVPAQTSAGP